jgi:hypothetical protein
MPRRLLVVEQRLILRGKGLRLIPGFVHEAGERIRAGDAVVLHRPDGSTFEANIQGTSTSVEWPSSNQLFLLLDVTNKTIVPIGTEVWSID